VGARYELRTEVSGEAFVTHPGPFSELLESLIERELGLTPELSTSGGTSDARFIKDVCPVVEFGLVGATIHQVDERVAVADLEALTRVYRALLVSYVRPA
jgi:succinyl-diaminopimelate desuccinylase